MQNSFAADDVCETPKVVITIDNNFIQNFILKCFYYERILKSSKSGKILNNLLIFNQNAYRLLN